MFYIIKNTYIVLPCNIWHQIQLIKLEISTVCLLFVHIYLTLKMILSIYKNFWIY